MFPLGKDEIANVSPIALVGLITLHYLSAKSEAYEEHLGECVVIAP